MAVGFVLFVCYGMMKRVFSGKNGYKYLFFRKLYHEMIKMCNLQINM